MRRLPKWLALIALMTGFLAAAPVAAGDNEIEFLRSYVGDWKGAGVLVGGAEPERFTCRMTVAAGAAARINYSGRCAVAGLNLSVRGAIIYSDKNKRYEAAMSSNTAFSGVAPGKRQGSTIVFDLKERETDDEGTDMTIGSQILLKDGRITIDFQIMFNDSGQQLTTSVPFAKS